MLQTVNKDGKRLPSSATDTYVGPACGHKAVFAEALVRAGGVHAARVLARTGARSRFCTLVNVWKKYTQVPIHDFQKTGDKTVQNTLK